MAYLRSKAKASEPAADAKCSWNPDWKLSVVGSKGEAVLATVQADTSILWSADALHSAFQISVQTAQQELAAFRQA